ncbi:integral membrane sensor signal transduction histidine kinase [Arcobacter nitrofigilis DSM 7299]|uniref:histidine kinase n=1 Tax=Arcobacter nitrofigilis (strain ATCC 33309 / DSM 7299 / CCUG 15893 / LMG 7604 / NCTC 12251 / CI) TaxID=572480 RepID=D5V3Y9_ARCNC|nr:HAMP domain-containing sensor histidine kinase [Arcobacter nitrofigilis]ADG92817.1 integral membrane sensor signal transduction histidine kinase [Arcobacter nitrofigilis DSM 7299]
MFNKDGIPFFIIMIPFLCIIFCAFFISSYYMKVSEQNFQDDVKILIQTYPKKYFDAKIIQEVIKDKRLVYEKNKSDFLYFINVVTLCVLFFMALFTFLMTSIVKDIVNKYMSKVENEQNKLKNLNETLSSKVAFGIEEGKRKDKAILEQSKMAKVGSMISMIAHQWRQPLSELSGVLMELETATRFKKVDEKHILTSIDRSNEMIEFMSNTIDDFRNFYKPDKKKEYFNISDACKKAINLVDATLHNLSIDLIFDIKKDKKIFGYPTEYSQVILNLISNAKDILVEKQIKNPKIYITITSRGMQSIVIIKDNAGGIDEENLDLIFDPYYSTKDSSKGTGLGLYISKLIIEKNMGGELSVQNDNQGAVFKVIVLG